MSATKDELLGYYETMYRIRRMEIACDMLYKAKEIRGFLHLYDGQEAVAVGMMAELERGDSMITSYRDHAWYLLHGGSVHQVIAELMGKATGCSTGKGGSMHLYNKAYDFYGGQGIVGAQVPVGVGLAFAHKYLDDGKIGVAAYGDGAANQGQVFEVMNMASLWKLPCIFLCENNHYGMGTAEWRAAANHKYYTRGDYIPGIKVDGMDVLAVKSAAKFARAHVLEHGPLVVEMDTYRYHGHSMSDPGSTYRTRDEVSDVRQRRDPIEHVKKLLLDAEFVQPTELKKLEKAVKKEVDDAVVQARNDPYPGTDILWQHIYKAPLGMTLKGIDSKSSVVVK